MNTCNNLRFLLFSLLFVSVLGLSSCGDDEKDVANCSIDFSAQFQDEIDAVTDAAIIYGNDPTPANCNAYKQAALNYVSAIEAIEDCYRDNGYGDEFEEAIDSARESANDIDC